MEKVARQVEQSHSVSGLHIQSQLIESEYYSQSNNGKTFQILAVAAASKKPSLNQKNSAVAQIIVALPQQGKYQATIELQARVPRIPFRWSLQSLLSQPISMWNKIRLTYGPGSSSQGSQQKEAELELDWSKTESQKEFVRQSAEYEKCMEESQKERPLTSVCIETRHKAASVDKVHAKAVIPRSWTHSPVFQRFASIVKGYYMPNLAQNIMSTIYQTEETSEQYNQYEQYHQQQQGNNGQLNAEAELYFAHNGDAIKRVEVLAPARLSLENIRLPRQVQGFAPLSLRNGVLPRLVQKITRDQAPASCRVQPEFISTFDNRTYGYQMNSCEHLLFKDCSDRRPIAVLAESAQSSGSQQKNVKVISGNYVIYAQAKHFNQGQQQVQIQVNGSPVTIQKNQQPRVWHSRQSGQADLEIVLSEDNVLSIRNLIDGLQVFYNGKTIEIIAPQNMHNRACGLCGDLNLENTADVKTPKQCVLKRDRFNAYSYMKRSTLEGQSCSGIPSQDRAEYEREISQCTKSKQIPTNVVELAKALRSSGAIKPISLKHVTKQEQNQVCFSKKRVLVCTGSSQPKQIKTQELKFACITKPSSKAEQLLLRANAGELLSELQPLPTSFVAKRQVPTKCSKSNGQQMEQENSYDNYRNSPRY